MRLLMWLQACLLVYSRRLAATSRKTKMFAAAIVFTAIIASLLGLLATICTMLIACVLLPLLNPDIKNEIDREYTNRQ